MGSLRREVGFWGSVGRLRLADLATVEILGGAVLGIAGAVLMVRTLDVGSRISVAGDYLQLVSALLGIVFAGLALVVALISENYLRLLNQGPNGILGFLSPFMIAIGLQVATVLAAVAYRASALKLSGRAVESWAFGVVTVLFVVAALDVVALARSVLMHGLARARLQEVTDLQSERERKRGNA